MGGRANSTGDGYPRELRGRGGRQNESATVDHVNIVSLLRSTTTRRAVAHGKGVPAQDLQESFSARMSFARRQGHEAMYASHNGAVMASRTAASESTGQVTTGGAADHSVSSLIVLLATCATK